MHLLPDYGPWICKHLVNLGWLKLCSTIAMAQSEGNGIGISIWDLYQVCCNTREQWLGPHDPQHHAYTSWLGSLEKAKSGQSWVAEIVQCH